MPGIEQAKTRLIRNYPTIFSDNMSRSQIITLLLADNFIYPTPWEWRFTFEVYMGKSIPQNEWLLLCDTIYNIKHKIPLQTSEKLIALEAMKKALGFELELPKTLYD